MNNETTYRNIFASIMITTLIAGYSFAHQETTKVYAKNNEVVVFSPTPTAKSIIVTHSDTPEEYIKEVFGEYAPKAFLLLKGSSTTSCAENRSLDKKAYNRNWIKGKEGQYWSTDWGLFMINDKFHPVKELKLDTDWKANVRYGFRMFQKDGYTFSKRWTAGKCLKRLGYEI